MQQLKLTSSFKINLNLPSNFLCFQQYKQQRVICLRVLRLASFLQLARSNILLSRYTNGCLKRQCRYYSSTLVKQYKFQLKDSIINTFSKVSYSKNGCPNWRTTGTVFKGVIRTFFKLLKYTYKLSISARQSRKGVLTLII